MKSFKWLIPLIICIGSFMIHTNNVKAYTQSEVLGSEGYNYFNINQDEISKNIYPDHPLFSGVGEGTVVFTVLTSNSGQPVDQIRDIYIYSKPNIFTCSLGTVNSYIDSTQQRVLYTVQCNVNFTSGKGINYIRFNRPDVYGVLKVNFSTYITFVSKDSAVDVSSIVNAINSQTSYLISNNNANTTSIINSINSVYSSINSILSSVNDIDTKLNDIKNNSSAISSNTEQIKNDIKDSSIDNNNTSSSANTWADKNATNGTITNLLTLPISLLQNILNGIQTSCSSFSLGTLFGTELILPCISLSSLIGSTLFNVIDLLFSGFMILNIAKKLIKIFNDFTNLKSNQIDEIYSNGGGAS